MEYYYLDENHASWTLNSRFIGCQNLYQLQNLKILSKFQGHKNPHGQNFWNLNFFLSEKATLHRYYQNRNQLVVTQNMAGTLVLGQKSWIWDILVKICKVSKSIPAIKSQNFVNISGAQKHTWAKFLEFDFFI